MKTILFTAAGVGLLMLTAYDVYATVLHARSRYGPVGERLNRTVWRVARWVAFRLSRARRHHFLNGVGPLLLPLLIGTYIVLLVAAFALVYYPRMESQFAASRREPGSLGFVDALYFSGVTLTTVGYGDTVPQSAQMRLVALVESAMGLTLVSLSIAYLISVYNALGHKRATALSLYQQAGEGADAAGYIAHHFVEGRFTGLREELRTIARDIQLLLEHHVEHPVIHYFHPQEVYKSLPRILFLLLESCAVMRACLDTEHYSALLGYPEVRTLEANAKYVLDELVNSLDLERRSRTRDAPHAGAEDDERRWRRRYVQTLERLAAEGIRVQPDREAGWLEYRAQREEWESKLRRLALYLGYDWEEVTGDRDLEYAADEKKEEPRATTLG